MSNSVTIRVPARLHLGFLDLSGDARPPFRQPRPADQRAADASSLRVSRETWSRVRGRARRAASRGALRALGHPITAPADRPRGDSAACRPRLRNPARARRGRRLAHPAWSAARYRRRRRAARARRALRHRHCQLPEGGVIVDAGRGPHGGPPPVVARLPFPDEWRVILILDDRRKACMARPRSPPSRRCRRFRPAAPAKSAGWC